MAKKKSKKKPSKPQVETRTSLTFPSLHQKVFQVVSHEIPTVWFYQPSVDEGSDSDSDGNSDEEYQTHVMGGFKCRNGSCSTKGWYSKKVAILIKGYDGDGYTAIVFNQRCRSCEELGTFKLDEKSYVDRVAYRLRKWAGVAVEAPIYGGRGGPPHRRELCEGCRRGICSL